MTASASTAADPGEQLPLSPIVFAILLALSDGDKHGYGIKKEVGTEAGGGLTIGPGTLYGSLDRMLRSGLIEETGVADYERRRYYRLTSSGSQVLAAEAGRLERAVASARRKGVGDVAKPPAASYNGARA